MTETREPASTRRILVALDASQSSLSALEAASVLASVMRCELAGLFIEDADLIALASLPFAREVRTQGGGLHALNLETLQKEQELRMASARHALERAAGRRKLRWSFRSVRGNLHAEVTAAAAEVDFVCVGQPGRASLHRARPGVTPRLALLGAAPVLIVGDAVNTLDAPVAVIYDPSVGPAGRVRLGAEIAQKTGNDLVILVLGSEAGDMAEARSQLSEHLPATVPTRYLPFDPGDPATLPETVRAGQFGLIISRTTREAATPSWLELMATVVGCPLLLVPDATEPGNRAP